MVVEGLNTRAQGCTNLKVHRLKIEAALSGSSCFLRCIGGPLIQLTVFLEPREKIESLVKSPSHNSSQILNVLVEAVERAVSGKGQGKVIALVREFE